MTVLSTKIRHLEERKEEMGKFRDTGFGIRGTGYGLQDAGYKSLICCSFNK